MKFKNCEMGNMIEALEPLLERRDRLGYAAARNTRILTTEAAEYLRRRDELVIQHGEPVNDDAGNPTGTYRLEKGSDAFDRFARDLEDYAGIEHDVDLYRIPEAEAVGELTGRQLLDLWWMLEEE